MHIAQVGIVPSPNYSQQVETYFLIMIITGILVSTLAVMHSDKILLLDAMPDL